MQESGFLAALWRLARLGVNLVTPARTESLCEAALYLHLLFIAAEQATSSDSTAKKKKKHAVYLQLYSSQFIMHQTAFKEIKERFMTLLFILKVKRSETEIQNCVLLTLTNLLKYVLRTFVTKAQLQHFIVSTSAHHITTHIQYSHRNCCEIKTNLVPD